MSSLALTSPRTRTRTWAGIVIFTALFSLLFQYRILSLLKRLGTDISPIGTRLPISLDFQGAPLWLLPFYHTLDYLNTVWFTTLLGLLVAGAVVTFLPDFVNGRLRGDGFSQHVSGVLLGLPNMLCTCCAATTLPGLRKAGAGLGATLAFFVTAPALNIVVILLAFQMLPLKLAIIRSVLGLVAALGVTYAVAKLYPAVLPEAAGTALRSREVSSLAGLLLSWLRHTWNTARAAVPLLVAGILAISVFKTLLPFEVVAKNLGDGVLPTLVVSAVGTILMAPTFTEVLWVSEFTRQGMGDGPAIALLITLPAVSLPSLWVLGRVFRSYELALSLGIAIFVLGVASGTLLAMI